MIRCFVTNPGEKGLIETKFPEQGGWIHLENPTLDEISEIARRTGMPEQFLRSALDEEEVAHVDVEDDTRLFVVDIPKMVEEDGSDVIFTVPLALVQNERYLVTVCMMHTWVVEDFFLNKIKNVDTMRRTKLIYQILYYNATRFLYYLRQIDKASDRIQRGLSKSMQNKEILMLLELQKSLVFFSASLTANSGVIQKISNNHAAKATEDEQDILEDVVIENKQALAMCLVYREIIKNTMDAFASVVSNNQNGIMKFLTAITIILTIPMILAGFWGMNMPVPWQEINGLWAFWVVVVISLVMSVIVWIMLMRRKML